MHVFYDDSFLCKIYSDKSKDGAKPLIIPTVFCGSFSGVTVFKESNQSMYKSQYGALRINWFLTVSVIEI